ncbi:MAG: response regulator transcription factor [Anaerolineaceae bacterium]|nr:response regulator transcription factor [Anaerolineaceae bacterium]
MDTKVLLLERKHASLPNFTAGLIRKKYKVATVKSGGAALEEMLSSDFHLVVVNAASMRTTGKRICHSIQTRYGEKHIPIILVVETPFKQGEYVDADVILVLPFTLQKLINRIRPFEPSEMKNVIMVGEIVLDLDYRSVHYKGSQKSLTPRLIALLKILMEHSGEVVKREDIFRAVWETDFIDDMRTLDVHVSWLRQAIEEDPRHPKMIKTVRGVGYKLVAV